MRTSGPPQPGSRMVACSAATSFPTMPGVPSAAPSSLPAQAPSPLRRPTAHAHARCVACEASLCYATLHLSARRGGYEVKRTQIPPAGVHLASPVRMSSSGTPRPIGIALPSLPPPAVLHSLPHPCTPSHAHAMGCPCHAMPAAPFTHHPTPHAPEKVS